MLGRDTSRRGKLLSVGQVRALLRPETALTEFRIAHHALHHGVVEHLLLLLLKGLVRNLHIEEDTLHIGRDMLVADFPVTTLLLQQPLQRRRRNDGDEDLMLIVLPLVYCHFPLLVSDLFVADFNIEVADDGVFAHAPFRDVELQLLCLFGECRHFGFVLLLSLGELLFRFELFGLRSVGHLRAFIVVINAVFQLFDVIALFLKSFEYCGRRFAVCGQCRTRIVLEEFHGLLHEKLVILAEHALAVLAARATARTFVLEQHLIGRIVLAGKALRLIEVVAFQLGHVTLVEPPGDLLDPRRLPRAVTPLGEMIVVDLLLDVGGIFGDLCSDAHRNLLFVEHPGQGVDQFAKFQTRADVGLRLAEFAHEALDRMPPRLQGPLVGGGFLARPHVLALQVLRDGGILGLGVRQIPHQGRNEFQIRHGGSPVATLAVDDLEALVPRTHADRLQYARLSDALGKFQQRIFAEVFAGIVGRIDDLVQIQQPDIRLGMGCRLFGRTGFCDRIHSSDIRCLRFGGFHVGTPGCNRVLRLRRNGLGNGRRPNCGLTALLRFRICFRSLHNM